MTTIRNIASFSVIGIALLTLTGCVTLPQYELKPMVPNYGLKVNDVKIKKKIYIGIYEDKINQLNPTLASYGKLMPYKNFYPYSENIKFAETLNEIVQSELQRRLLNKYTDVELVRLKPKDLKSDEIFIDGNITNLNINQYYVKSSIKAFDIKNEYKFKISSNVNNIAVHDSFDTNLNMVSKVLKDQINTSGMVLALLFDFNQIDGRHDYGQLIDHKLIVNNQLIADIQYYHYLQDGVGHFKVDYEEGLVANIFGKYPQKIKDKESDSVFKHNAYGKQYLYFSGGFDPFGSPTYNNGWLNSEKWYNKSPYYTNADVERIKNELDVYNKCLDYNHLNFMNKKECPSAPYPENISDINIKYYDIFRQYTTTSGILQYMINEHIDNIIKEIEK